MKITGNNMTIVDYTKSETLMDNAFFKEQLLDELENSWRKTRAIKHIEFVSKVNPYAAKKFNEDYVMSYPNDYIEVTYYISSLINVGELDAAEKELKYLVDIFNTKLKELGFNEDFNREDLPNSLKYLYDNIAISTLKLYCHQNRLKEAFDYYKKHQEFFKGKYAAYILFYLKCKNNICNIDDVESYLYKQISDYSEELFKEKMLEEQKNQGNGVDASKASYFFKNFPLEKVYEEIKEYLPLLDGLYLDNIWTTYIFCCKNCGISKGRMVNYFKVVVFNGTFDVVEMKPVQGFYGLPEYYDFTEFTKGGNIIKKTRL